MKYDVVIKGTVSSEDDVEVDKDALGEALADEIDNTDMDVDADVDDEDIQVSYRLSIDDVEVTPAAE